MATNPYIIFSLNTTYEGVEAVKPLFERQCIEEFGEGAVFKGYPYFTGTTMYDENSKTEIKIYDLAANCNGCLGKVFEEKKRTC